MLLYIFTRNNHASTTVRYEFYLFHKYQFDIWLQVSDVIPQIPIWYMTPSEWRHKLKFHVRKHQKLKWVTNSMFGGAYGDARMPNWPYWHRTPLPGIATTGLRRDKGWKMSYLLWWSLSCILQSSVMNMHSFLLVFYHTKWHIDVLYHIFIYCIAYWCIILYRAIQKSYNDFKSGRKYLKNYQQFIDILYHIIDVLYCIALMYCIVSYWCIVLYHILIYCITQGWPKVTCPICTMKVLGKR